MLPGKYVDVVTRFNDPLELTGKVKEGYLKIAWRSESSIKIGYILTQRGKIVGSIMEDIFGNTFTEGETAFFGILEAIKHGQVKAVEVYEADVNKILKANPKACVTFDENRPTSGNDIDSFLSLLKTYRGGIKIQDGSKAWMIYVEDGVVKAARALRGSTHRGDRAIKEIFHEMDYLLKEGRYITTESFEFSSEDTVQNGEVFLEGIELLREKQRLERDSVGETTMRRAT